MQSANVTYTQAPQPEPPIADPPPQFSGRGGGRGGRGRGGLSRGRKNGNNGGQSGQSGQAGQDNQQGNATGGGTGTIPKEKSKCTLCQGPHTNLMHCPKLPQYLPYGNNQVPPPASLCLKCLGTKSPNANQCNHKGNKYWDRHLCSTSNKHYIMCTDCSHHLPALEYLSKHHNPAIGFQNFSLMRQMFGADVYSTLSSTVSESAFNSLPAVPMSVSL